MTDTNFTPLGATPAAAPAAQPEPATTTQNAAPFPFPISPEPAPVASRKDVRTYKPYIPERIRTIAYFVIGISAPLVGFATAAADIWVSPHLAAEVAATGVALLSAVGTVSGVFGIAYRPTR